MANKIVKTAGKITAIYVVGGLVLTAGVGFLFWKLIKNKMKEDKKESSALKDAISKDRAESNRKIEEQRKAFEAKVNALKNR